jgi:hypothetical protein
VFRCAWCAGDDRGMGGAAAGEAALVMDWHSPQSQSMARPGCAAILFARENKFARICMATAQAYYDLDAILADQQARTHAHAPTRAACVRCAAVCVYSPHTHTYTHTQKLPCTFDVDCPNVGFLIHGDNSPDVRTLDAAAVHSACTRALCVLMRGRVCLCVCVCVCVGGGGCRLWRGARPSYPCGSQSSF